ncbi:Phosphotransferase enzyme family protein [Sporotomaculum syntrophicum]|uniref:non-specific serine/threonine protein kinase n=1 Tax=Sporotomaculum syntrophicum TaxID=182264 RepID=A0A9D2WLW4_9FIRM|nr:RIO1 family regulatory kinase/ATPase [Sporotomaculum syntrophicum]KAF1083790.1 Phosphotransferase enzyme family protein [Sporotomaculum syntrophicum]
MEWKFKLEKYLNVKLLNYHHKKSFRNNVYLVEVINQDNLKMKFIVKKYEKPKAGNEAFIINSLRNWGLLVPQIIWNDNNIIIMEYIDGILLTDLLSDTNINHQDWVNHLARWLYQLHGTIRHADSNCLCKSDLNLRNFVFTGENNFYGLDFEEVCYHPPERDLGGLCAFILNNDPMFTQWKFRICSLLVENYSKLNANTNNYQLDYQAIQYYLIEEMKAAAERREKQRPYLLAKIEELGGELNIFNSSK